MGAEAAAEAAAEVSEVSQRKVLVDCAGTANPAVPGNFQQGHVCQGTSSRQAHPALHQHRHHLHALCWWLCSGVALLAFEPCDWFVIASQLRLPTVSSEE